MELLELINKASAEFDRLLAERHEEGATKYGPFKFLEANTVEEAMFELVDLSNYARYTYIKLWLMNLALDKELGEDPIIVGSGFFSGKPSMDTDGPQEQQ